MNHQKRYREYVAEISDLTNRIREFEESIQDLARKAEVALREERNTANVGDRVQVVYDGELREAMVVAVYPPQDKLRRLNSYEVMFDDAIIWTQIVYPGEFIVVRRADESAS